MKINILRDGGVAVCFLVLMFLISQKIEADAVKTFTGRYRVVDGDSLALGKTRFRLLGIDAPELSQVCTRDGKPWTCGEAAKERLAAFIGDGNVDCKGGRKDKYRRLLVTCFRNRLNINREMVRLGMAVTYGDYQTEEEKARDAHAGRDHGWCRVSRDIGAPDMTRAPSLVGSGLGGE